MPRLKPPFADGLFRGTPFKWVVQIVGGWGQQTFEKEDGLPGQAPSAVSANWSGATTARSSIGQGSLTLNPNPSLDLAAHDPYLLSQPAHFNGAGTSMLSGWD